MNPTSGSRSLHIPLYHVTALPRCCVLQSQARNQFSLVCAVTWPPWEVSHWPPAIGHLFHHGASRVTWPQPPRLCLLPGWDTRSLPPYIKHYSKFSSKFLPFPTDWQASMTAKHYNPLILASFIGTYSHKTYTYSSYVRLLPVYTRVHPCTAIISTHLPQFPLNHNSPQGN